MYQETRESKDQQKDVPVTHILVKKSMASSEFNYKKREYVDQIDIQQTDNFSMKRDNDQVQNQDSFEDQIYKLNETIDIIRINTLIEKQLRKEQTSEVKEILLLIIKKSQDCSLKLKEEKPKIYDQLLKLKPNIFTYSMLFKTMHIDIKKHKNTGNNQSVISKDDQQRYEEHYISEANQYWYDLVCLGNELRPNIIVLNQYIQIYLVANQNSNALQLYKEYMSKFKLIPDRITLVNLERISYKLTQSIIQYSKKTQFNQFEIQRLLNQTKDVNQIFLEQSQFDDFEDNKDKYENVFKYVVEVNTQRYDLIGVLKISKILYQRFNLSRIYFMKQAFTYFYQNILQNQGQISKIINVYAEHEDQSIQEYLESSFSYMIDELVVDENLNQDSVGEMSFIQIVKIYMEQLQILFRYNSIQGILILFVKQLSSIPRLQKAKILFLSKSKNEQQPLISYPDIHTICLVVKCLIRCKAPNQALKVTQFFKDNCVSDKGEHNLLETIDSQYKDDHEDVLVGLRKVKHLIFYDINTFFLNGVIIELNSRHLYQHAIRLFQWMDRNTLMNHRPNTSTYNMIILVYGSMQEYNKAKSIFYKMQDQWKALNDNSNNMEQYEAIYQAANVPKNRSRTSSSGQTQTLQKIDISDSDDELQANSSNKDFQSPHNEVQQFKHASDAIQQHFDLQFPPTNVNTYISLSNILSRQRLYKEIIDLLNQAKQANSKAIHPILQEDLNGLAPLYQSIVKNLLQAKNDEIKVKACNLAVESLEDHHIIQDTSLYFDCLNFLQLELQKKKNPQVALLEVKLSNLIDDKNIKTKSDHTRRNTTIKKVASNDNFNRGGYKSGNRSFRKDDNSSTSGRDSYKEDFNSTPRITPQKSYFTNTSMKLIMSSKDITVNQNNQKVSQQFEIEEMLEDDSPVIKKSNIKVSCQIDKKTNVKNETSSKSPSIMKTFKID